MGLLELPLELLHHILSLLSLRSVHLLGATCRQLHRIIHQNDAVWRLRCVQDHRVLLWSSDIEADQDLTDDLVHKLDGIVRDTTLQGHKELFLLSSQEFREAVRARDGQRTGALDLERLLRSFLPKAWSTQREFLDENFSTRLALFGPGIESPNTKLLVHRLVNAHTSDFNAVDFVSGQPGGFGSGVRIDFRKMYKFDLICLYTHFERVRESHRGATRLDASHNRLLDGAGAASRQTEDACQPRLNESVAKLLPTLHALVFALDAAAVSAAETEDARREQLGFLRRELELMTEVHSDGDSGKTPVLVLCCDSQSKATSGNDLAVNELSDALKLKPSSCRPWAIFNVNVKDLCGLAQGLDWLLYHVQKARSDLNFHRNQSSRLY